MNESILTSTKKMLGITEKSSASALAKARNQLKKSINNYLKESGR